MDLNEISVFVKVVQLGSFSAAAKRLNMPVSTVSHKVAALERRLGLTLIRRTTRKLSITLLGQTYFKQCLEALAQIESAEVELASHAAAPKGLLKITAPFEMGLALSDLIAKFTDQFAEVRVELVLTDRRVDLLTENFDLAIRAGALQDSSLIAKKLGETWFGVYGSPDYVHQHKHLEHPRELITHRCLQFTPLGTESWQLYGTGATSERAFSAPLPGRIMANDLGSVCDLAVNGKGLALLPNFTVHDELQKKRLVRVLPEWRTLPSPMHFVYPAQRFVSSKLSEFIKIATVPMREIFREDFQGKSVDTTIPPTNGNQLGAKLGARKRDARSR